MPAPWIEAWKAWLSRVAERFVQSQGPSADASPQRAPPPKGRGPATQAPEPARKRPPHRSGQRHG